MLVDQNLNHSAAHLLAAAVLKLYPNTKLGIGPAIDEGFYYDFAFETPINDLDLRKIEKEMSKIAQNNYHFVKVENYVLKNQPFKKILINQFSKEGKTITYYGMQNLKTHRNIFIDLCKGGHINSTIQLKHFKLLSLAGAYWKGDSKNPQLTRIYGTAWKTAKELNDYLKVREERKERDHRKIGKEMEIFMFSPLTGQGFPIWLENGMIIKQKIKNYLIKEEQKSGFIFVETPAFGEQKIYETSGHLLHYKDDMFPIIDVDNEKLVMRPMTCPHHIVIYKSKSHSYRELPLRISEHAQLYRYEKSGALSGLERVRSMQLTDAHIFCREDQIISEFQNSYQLIDSVLKKFNIKIDYISLSLHDPNKKDKYYKDEKMWELAENNLKIVLEKLNLPYQVKIGEAAFYGPKIDIQVRNALGHEITLSTLQLDFLLPKKFDLKYIDKDKKTQTPIMIHRGLVGTYERFIAILLEQYKGNLPFWIAPRQIIVIPVNLDAHIKYCDAIYAKLLNYNFRVKVDYRNQSLSKKIREAQIGKTKWQIIIGDKEVDSHTISVREYGATKSQILMLKDFIKLLLAQNS